MALTAGFKNDLDRIGLHSKKLGTVFLNLLSRRFS